MTVLSLELLQIQICAHMGKCKHVHVHTQTCTHASTHEYTPTCTEASIHSSNQATQPQQAIAFLFC